MSADPSLVPARTLRLSQLDYVLDILDTSDEARRILVDVLGVRSIAHLVILTDEKLDDASSATRAFPYVDAEAIKLFKDWFWDYSEDFTDEVVPLTETNWRAYLREIHRAKK